MCKYVDDCTMFECIPKGSESNLQKVLDGLQSWSLEKNNMMLNPTKTKDLWIFFQKSPTQPDALHINDVHVERVFK